ncbi:MAG: radical SAM protein [Clostridia bacterium]|nr:radical SAM protein [Clostridia bacterium]
MKIGLIDVDGHHFPNLALMKISAWHKLNGDDVEWCFPFNHYDIVYQSKVFDETYSADIDWVPNADKIVKGGTGYGLTETLPDYIEHIYPDYTLYPKLTKDTAYGYLTRGCPRGCSFCIVAEKEGRRSYKVADLSEFWRGQKYIKLLDPNLLACRDHMELLEQLCTSKSYIDFTQGLDIRMTNDENIDLINRLKIKEIHFAWDNPKEDLSLYFEEYRKLAKHKPHGTFGTVYCLTNFGSTMQENLYRIYTLRDMGFDPYVMIYDKPTAPKGIKDLQRWVNNKIIFRSCKKFDEYQERSRKR